MPRVARVVVPGLPHHVFTRANNRRRLFARKLDFLMFLRCLTEGLRKSKCVLHQLTLMKNHIHMIVTPPAMTSLATLMHTTCQRYTQFHNAKRGASGKLFEERFHSKVIADDRHLMTTTLYNDANAFRANDAKKPLSHTWSTGPLHAGKDAPLFAALWSPSPWYRALGTSSLERARHYEDLMAAYTDGEIIAPDDAPDDVPMKDSRRLLRPNGTSAREVPLRYGRKPK